MFISGIIGLIDSFSCTSVSCHPFFMMNFSIVFTGTVYTHFYPCILKTAHKISENFFPYYNCTVGLKLGKSLLCNIKEKGSYVRRMHGFHGGVLSSVMLSHIIW
jgi:hypothetical protein